MADLLKKIADFFAQLFSSYSTEATHINHIFIAFLVVAGLVFLLVLGLSVASVIRFHARKRPNEPKQIFGNNKLEILWTSASFIAVAVFFVISVRSMEAINTPVAKNRKPDIVVIGHQWWWEMRYPEYGFTTANELHIPEKKKLLMRMESADVIHDWWVPSLGRKIDMIPGHSNYRWIQADTAGTYEGTCSEYCGAEHAWMRIRVIAQTQDNFNQWVKAQEEIPAIPTDSLAREGAKLFQSKTCSNCHTIRGTAAEKRVGPDLTHLESRETLLSGMYNNTTENLRQWLKNPQKVKPGAHMPNFNLSDKELNALVAYLEELK